MSPGPPCLELREDVESEEVGRCRPHVAWPLVAVASATHLRLTTHLRAAGAVGPVWPRAGGELMHIAPPRCKLHRGATGNKG